MTVLFVHKERPVQWIAVKKLRVVWPDAQRGRHDRAIQEIAKDFNPDLFGTATVTPVKNRVDLYHVIDGQTRIEAVRLLWGEEEKVPCVVLSGKDAREAARVFVGMNGTRVRPQPVEMFHARVKGGFDDEVAVKAILSKLGYQVSVNKEDGNLAAIAAVLSVYKRRGGDMLRLVLGTINETWGSSRDAVHGSIIMGYADLLYRYSDLVDVPRLVARISKSFTPARLIAAARTSRGMFGGGLAENMRKVLVSTYNKGIRTKPKLGDDA